MTYTVQLRYLHLNWRQCTCAFYPPLVSNIQIYFLLDFSLFCKRSVTRSSEAKHQCTALSYYANHSEEDNFLSSSTIHLYQQHTSCFVAFSVELWKICKRGILDTIFSRYRVEMSSLSPSCMSLLYTDFTGLPCERWWEW